MRFLEAQPFVHQNVFTSVDLDTGERVWTYEMQTRAGSVLATAGDLVFLADSGGVLRAFDALGGEPLWRYAVQGYRVRSVVSSYAVGPGSRPRRAVPARVARR